MFKADIKAADINCDGCQSESPRLFSYCSTCEIRKCAREKKVATCAACPEYSCAETGCVSGPGAGGTQDVGGIEERVKIKVKR